MVVVFVPTNVVMWVVLRWCGDVVLLECAVVVLCRVC